MAFNILEIVSIPFYFAIPALILYFVIKLAVRDAIKELKENKTL